MMVPEIKDQSEKILLRSQKFVESKCAIAT